MNSSHSFRRTTLLLLLLGAFSSRLTSVRAQGALTPPGAPAAVMKSLDQVEPRIPISTTPFSITNGGSYYLTTSITNGFPITISADDVTLDLSGFALSGAPGSGIGIYVNFASSNITIRNGTIRNYSSNAVYAASSFNCLLENLKIIGNGGGISVSNNCMIRNCLLVNNGNGIIGGDGVNVRDCVTTSNANRGISLGANGSAVNCQSLENTVDGIFIGTCAVVKGSVTAGNGRYGIRVDLGSTVEDSVSRSNTATGIYMANGSRGSVRGCSSSSNGAFGFLGDHGAVFDDCNSYANAGDGFRDTTGCTYVHCRAESNSGNGFNCSDGAMVEECTAVNNVLDGIQVSNQSMVKDNHCYNNTDAGIQITGSSNRINGNSVNNNSPGFQVDGIHNIIFNNTADHNSTANYNIVTLNVVGVIEAPVPTSTVISGNTGGTGLGTTDPWANFSY